MFILAITHPCETKKQAVVLVLCFLQGKRNLLPKRLLFSLERQKERQKMSFIVPRCYRCTGTFNCGCNSVVVLLPQQTRTVKADF